MGPCRPGAPAAGHATSVRPVSQPDTVNTGARTAMTASPTAGRIGPPIAALAACAAGAVSVALALLTFRVAALTMSCRSR